MGHYTEQLEAEEQKRRAKKRTDSCFKCYYQFTTQGSVNDHNCIQYLTNRISALELKIIHMNERE